MDVVIEWNSSVLVQHQQASGRSSQLACCINTRSFMRCTRDQSSPTANDLHEIMLALQEIDRGKQRHGVLCNLRLVPLTRTVENLHSYYSSNLPIWLVGLELSVQLVPTAPLQASTKHTPGRAILLVGYVHVFDFQSFNVLHCNQESSPLLCTVSWTFFCGKDVSAAPDLFGIKGGCTLVRWTCTVRGLPCMQEWLLV
jgi:hypothetical protein